MTDGKTAADGELAGALAGINDRLAGIEQQVGELLKIWEDHAHIIVAFRRGGIMAARTAARRGGSSQ